MSYTILPPEGGPGAVPQQPQQQAGYTILPLDYTPPAPLDRKTWGDAFSEIFTTAQYVPYLNAVSLVDTGRMLSLSRKIQNKTATEEEQRDFDRMLVEQSRGSSLAYKVFRTALSIPSFAIEFGTAGGFIKGAAKAGLKKGAAMQSAKALAGAGATLAPDVLERAGKESLENYVKHGVAKDLARYGARSAKLGAKFSQHTGLASLIAKDPNGAGSRMARFLLEDSSSLKSVGQAIRTARGAGGMAAVKTALERGEIALPALAAKAVMAGDKKALTETGMSLMRRNAQRVMVDALAREKLMLHRSIDGVMQAMTPQFQLDVDDQGNVSRILADDGDGFGLALWKGFGDMYIENVSEQTGEFMGFLMSAFGPKWTKNLLKAGWLTAAGKSINKATGGRISVPDGVKGFAKKLATGDGLPRALEKYGWNGMLAEYGEEVFGELARQGLGIKPVGMPDMDDVVATALGFALNPMAIGMTAFDQSTQLYAKKTSDAFRAVEANKKGGDRAIQTETQAEPIKRVLRELVEYHRRASEAHGWEKIKRTFFLNQVHTRIAEELGEKLPASFSVADDNSATGLAIRRFTLNLDAIARNAPNVDAETIDNLYKVLTQSVVVKDEHYDIAVASLVDKTKLPMQYDATGRVIGIDPFFRTLAPRFLIERRAEMSQDEYAAFLKEYPQFSDLRSASATTSDGGRLAAITKNSLLGEVTEENVDELARLFGVSRVSVDKVGKTRNVKILGSSRQDLISNVSKEKDLLNALVDAHPDPDFRIEIEPYSMLIGKRDDGAFKDYPIPEGYKTVNDEGDIVMPVGARFTSADSTLHMNPFSKPSDLIEDLIESVVRENDDFIVKWADALKSKHKDNPMIEKARPLELFSKAVAVIMFGVRPIGTYQFVEGLGVSLPANTSGYLRARAGVTEETQGNADIFSVMLNRLVLPHAMGGAYVKDAAPDGMSWFIPEFDQSDISSRIMSHGKTGEASDLSDDSLKWDQAVHLSPYTLSWRPILQEAYATKDRPNDMDFVEQQIDKHGRMIVPYLRKFFDELYNGAVEFSIPPRSELQKLLEDVKAENAEVQKGPSKPKAKKPKKKTKKALAAEAAAKAAAAKTAVPPPATPPVAGTPGAAAPDAADPLDALLADAAAVSPENAGAGAAHLKAFEKSSGHGKSESLALRPLSMSLEEEMEAELHWVRDIMGDKNAVLQGVEYTEAEQMDDDKEEGLENEERASERRFKAETAKVIGISQVIDYTVKRAGFGMKVLRFMSTGGKPNGKEFLQKEFLTKGLDEDAYQRMLYVLVNGIVAPMGKERFYSMLGFIKQLTPPIPYRRVQLNKASDESGGRLARGSKIPISAGKPWHKTDGSIFSAPNKPSENAEDNEARLYAFKDVKNRTIFTTRLPSYVINRLMELSKAGYEFFVLDGATGGGVNIAAEDMTNEDILDIQRASYGFESNPGNKTGGSHWQYLGKIGDKSDVIFVRHKNDTAIFADAATAEAAYTKLFQGLKEGEQELLFSPDEVRQVLKDLKERVPSTGGATEKFYWQYAASMLRVTKTVYGNLASFLDKKGAFANMGKRLSQGGTPGLQMIGYGDKRGKIRYIMFDDGGDIGMDGAAYMPRRYGHYLNSVLGSYIINNPDSYFMMKAFLYHRDADGNLYSLKPMFFDVSEFADAERMPLHDRMTKLLDRLNDPARSPEFWPEGETAPIVLIPKSSAKLKGATARIPMVNLSGTDQVKDGAGDVIINPDVKLTPESLMEIPGESIFITADFNYDPNGRTKQIFRQQEDIQLIYPPEVINKILKLRSAAAKLLTPGGGMFSFRSLYKEMLKEAETDAEAKAIRDFSDSLPDEMKDASLLDPTDRDFGAAATVIISQLKAGATEEEILSGPAGSDAWNIIARMYSKRIRGVATVFNKTAMPTGRTRAQEAEIEGPLGQNPESISTVTLSGRGVVGPAGAWTSMEELRSVVESNLRNFMELYPWIFKRNPIFEQTLDPTVNMITSEVDESRIVRRTVNGIELFEIPGSQVFTIRVPTSAESGQEVAYVEKADTLMNAALTGRRQEGRTGGDLDADATPVLALHFETDGTFVLPGNPKIDRADRAMQARALQNAAFLMAIDAAVNAAPEILSLRNLPPDVQLFDFADIFERLDAKRAKSIKKMNLPEGQQQFHELNSESEIGIGIGAAQSSALRGLEYIGAWLEVRDDVDVPVITFKDSAGQNRQIRISRERGTDIPLAGKAMREYYFYNTILNIIVDDPKHGKMSRLGWDRRTIPLMLSMIYANPQVQTREEILGFMRDVVEFLNSDLVREYSRTLAILDSDRYASPAETERNKAKAMFGTKFEKGKPVKRGSSNLNLFDSHAIALYRLIGKHGKESVMGLAWLQSISNDIRSFRTYTNGQYRGLSVSAAEQRAMTIPNQIGKATPPLAELNEADRRPEVHVRWASGQWDQEKKKFMFDGENAQAFFERQEMATDFYQERFELMPAALNKQIRAHYFRAARRGVPDMTTFIGNVKRLSYMLAVGRGKSGAYKQAELFNAIRLLKKRYPDNKFLAELKPWHLVGEGGKKIEGSDYFSVGSYDVLPGGTFKTFRAGDVHYSPADVDDFRRDFVRLTIEEQDMVILNILQRFSPQMRYANDGNPFFMVSPDAVLRTVRNAIPYMREMAKVGRIVHKGKKVDAVAFPSGFYKALYAAPLTYGLDSKKVFADLDPNAPMATNLLMNYSETFDEQDMESPYTVKPYRIEEIAASDAPAPAPTLAPAPASASAPALSPAPVGQQIIEGDLFEMPGRIAITTNLPGVHGAGVAKRAADLGLVKRGDGSFKITDKVIQFPVKTLWKNKADIGLIKNSFNKLGAWLDANPGEVVYLPLVGLGHGEGSPAVVVPIIKEFLAAHSNARLVLPTAVASAKSQVATSIRKDATQDQMAEIRALLADAAPASAPASAPARKAIQQELGLGESQALHMLDGLRGDTTAASEMSENFLVKALGMRVVFVSPDEIDGNAAIARLVAKEVLVSRGYEASLPVIAGSVIAAIRGGISLETSSDTTESRAALADEAFSFISSVGVEIGRAMNLIAAGVPVEQASRNIESPVLEGIVTASPLPVINPVDQGAAASELDRYSANPVMSFDEAFSIIRPEDELVALKIASDLGFKIGGSLVLRKSSEIHREPGSIGHDFDMTSAITDDTADEMERYIEAQRELGVRSPWISPMTAQTAALIAAVEKALPGASAKMEFGGNYQQLQIGRSFQNPVKVTMPNGHAFMLDLFYGDSQMAPVDPEVKAWVAKLSMFRDKDVIDWILANPKASLGQRSIQSPRSLAQEMKFGTPDETFALNTLEGVGAEQFEHFPEHVTSGTLGLFNEYKREADNNSAGQQRGTLEEWRLKRLARGLAGLGYAHEFVGGRHIVYDLDTPEGHFYKLIDTPATKKDAMKIISARAKELKQPTKEEMELADKVLRAARARVENSKATWMADGFAEDKEGMPTRAAYVLRKSDGAVMFEGDVGTASEHMTSNTLSKDEYEAIDNGFRVKRSEIAPIIQEIGAERFEQIVSEMKAMHARAREDQNKHMAEMENIAEWIPKFESSYEGSYVLHAYMRADEKPIDAGSAFIARENTRRVLKRTHDTYEEAMMKGTSDGQGNRFALRPISLNGAELIGMWYKDVSQAGMNKIMLSLATQTFDADGLPLFVPVLTGVDSDDKLLANDHKIAFADKNLREIISRLVADINIRRARKGQTPIKINLVEKDFRAEYNRIISNYEADLQDIGYITYSAGESIFPSVSRWLVKVDKNRSRGLRDPALWMIEHLERPRIQDKVSKRVAGAVTAVAKANLWAKHGALSLSLFHHFSLIESYIAMKGLSVDTITSALWPPKMIREWKDLSNNLRKNLANSEMSERWIRHGLNLRMQPPDVDENEIFKDLKSITDSKHTPKFLKKAASLWGRYIRLNDRILWQTMLPAFKLQSAEMVFDNVRLSRIEQNLPVNEEQLMREISTLINEGYGGINWNHMLWSTKISRQLMQLTIFAPDWTLSSLKAAGFHNLPWVSGKLNKMTQTEAQWLTNRYWPSMIFVVMGILPNAIQLATYLIAKLLPGPDDEEGKPFVFMNEQGKDGFLGTGLTGHIDITPLLRYFGWVPGVGYEGGVTGERRVYLRLAKQATEVFEGWATKTIPTALGKSSVAVKIAFEQITGTNSAGWELGFRDRSLMSGLFSGEDGLYDSRLGEIMKKFAPMSILSFVEGRPSTFFAPASRGMTAFTATENLAKVMAAYADDESYAAISRSSRARKGLEGLGRQIIEAAEMNGYDGEKIVIGAKRHVLGDLYSEFFEHLNSDNLRKLERTAEKIVRVNGSVEGAMKSMKNRFDNAGRPFSPDRVTAAGEAFNRATGEQVYTPPSDLVP